MNSMSLFYPCLQVLNVLSGERTTFNSCLMDFPGRLHACSSMCSLHNPVLLCRIFPQIPVIPSKTRSLWVSAWPLANWSILRWARAGHHPPWAHGETDSLEWHHTRRWKTKSPTALIRWKQGLDKQLWKMEILNYPPHPALSIIPLILPAFAFPVWDYFINAVLRWTN